MKKNALTLFAATALFLGSCSKKEVKKDPSPAQDIHTYENVVHNFNNPLCEQVNESNLQLSDQEMADLMIAFKHAHVEVLSEIELDESPLLPINDADTAITKHVVVNSVIVDRYNRNIGSAFYESFKDEKTKAFTSSKSITLSVGKDKRLNITEDYNSELGKTKIEVIKL